MNQKSKLIIIFCLFSAISFAQSSLYTTKGVTFPAYITGSRPAANTVGVGTVLYNTTDNTHQFSNGSTWLNLLGTTSVPSGTANQTLRNNGTGWVADALLRNDGTKVYIGAIAPNNPGVLNVNGTGILGGIQGKSDENFGVYGESNSSRGVFGYSSSYTGVYGYSITSSGVEGTTSNGIGVLGSSINSYGGKFIGRVRVAKGGNGDAGIEFEKSDFTQGGYIGMNGDNEMMVYGYPYGAIQRWNVNGGQICYATSPTICSDIRLKKDFSNLSNSLASITQLKGYNYYLKNEKNPNLQTGFIAQEIQKIFPELVNTGSDGYLSVDYTGLIPHLVESVKALKSENEELKERLLKIENFLKNNELKIETKTSKR